MDLCRREPVNVRLGFARDLELLERRWESRRRRWRATSFFRWEDSRRSSPSFVAGAFEGAVTVLEDRSVGGFEDCGGHVSFLVQYHSKRFFALP